jgi:hypothetical protein
MNSIQFARCLSAKKHGAIFNRRVEMTELDVGNFQTVSPVNMSKAHTPEGEGPAEVPTITKPSANVGELSTGLVNGIETV